MALSSGTTVMGTSVLSEAVRARQPVGEGAKKLNLVFFFLAVPTRCVHDL